ncbi:MAG: tRNA lysidine(34) synthetase TilS, partial [Ferruginibacter sp.]
MKASSLETRFKDYISKESLFNSKDRLLVAVSGGVDSIVLCHLCQKAGYQFAIAHCNFQLRGIESDQDSLLVKSIAAGYQVNYFEKNFDTDAYACANKVSTQVAARDLRYAWFKFLLKENNFNYLLTAHHQDDNVETVLLNFFKGTGIEGLKGILPKQKNIIRPLLFARKVDLVQYAASGLLPYRNDTSNESDKYTRNYFRNKVLPLIAEKFGAVNENIAANAERFRDIATIYQQAIDSTIKKLAIQKGEELHIPVLKLLQTPASKTVLFEIIRTHGFSTAQVDEAAKLLYSETGKYVNSITHRVFRYRQWLIISPLADLHSKCFIIEENDTSVSFEGSQLTFKKLPAQQKINNDPHNAMLNAKDIVYPLILRRWN